MKNQLQQLYSHYLQHPVVCTDTRQIKKDSLFFALKGGNFNGNEFAQRAIEQGCSLAIIDQEIYKKDERYILVPDALKALQELAQYHREHLTIPIIAITGSNGKTTTKELVNAVLSKRYFTKATFGNLNNHIGVPLTLLSITKQHEVAIIEMGANHIGEIALLCEIAQPGFGIITNIGKAHLEGFGGIQGVIKAKNEMYDFIKQHQGLLFVNQSNDLLMNLSENARKITYGEARDSDCIGEIIEVNPFVRLKWKSLQDKENIDAKEVLSSSLIGKYNFENILAAISIGQHFQVEAIKINEAIQNYIPANNRSEIIKKQTNTIWLDAYNANPTSMEAAIENFSALEADNKILILGDMLELGDESRTEHQLLIRLLKKKEFNNVFLIGNFFSEIENSINARVFKNVEQAYQWLDTNKISNSNLLIKGSRGIKLEKLIDVL